MPEWLKLVGEAYRDAKIVAALERLRAVLRRVENIAQYQIDAKTFQGAMVAFRSIVEICDAELKE